MDSDPIQATCECSVVCRQVLRQIPPSSSYFTDARKPQQVTTMARHTSEVRCDVVDERLRPKKRILD